LKQETTLKDRKVLEAKMASVFGEKISKLSTELQKILLDDMVTAFESRMNVLNQANGKAAN
jgi:fructose-specific component phosphotransferase system IIB-like protein